MPTPKAMTGSVAESFVTPRLKLAPPATQALVRVTQAVVARTLAFRFARKFTGLEVLAKGDPIAFDDGQTVVAPYDNTVLVMPSMKHGKPGNTMVRLGRFEATA